MGDRSAATAVEFVNDLKSRLANRVQLSTDGYLAYAEAVERSFVGKVDYTMLVHDNFGPGEVLAGNPDPDHASTSYVER